MKSQYPILAIPRSSGDQALLDYKLTTDEKRLFREMDSQTAALSKESDLAVYHEAVEQIGRKHGLDKRQSIAFWTRTTFSFFESE